MKKDTLQTIALAAIGLGIVYSCSYHPTAQDNANLRAFKSQQYLDAAASAESEAAMLHAKAANSN